MSRTILSGSAPDGAETVPQGAENSKKPQDISAIILASGTNWRHENIGRLLNNAVSRFESRVLALMSTKNNVATRMAHISLTRNLDIAGTRLTTLARRASMSKQAMGELVDQCVALGLVERVADPDDGRARLIMFTPDGLQWLAAFRLAVMQAEAEMRQQLGGEVMDLIVKGLAGYGAEFDCLED